MRIKFIWPFVSGRRHSDLENHAARLADSVRAWREKCETQQKQVWELKDQVQNLQAQSEASKFTYDRRMENLRTRVTFLEDEHAKLTAKYNMEAAVSVKRAEALAEIRATLQTMHHRI